MNKSRSNSRRCHVRRLKERRTITHVFDSPEWIAMMRDSFLLWPKEDRRNSDRREGERRNYDRRTTVKDAAFVMPLHRSHPQTMNAILSRDEQQMIMELYYENSSGWAD